jgi:NAD(P)H-hydrate epimerase
MSGAVALACKGAMRAGAGVVTAMVPRGVHLIVAAHCVEAITHGCAETDGGALDSAACDDLVHATARATAVALGPGLGRDARSLDVVRALLARIGVPIVLDADGLLALAHDGGAGRPDGAALVLTPHAGEMARLCGCDAARVERERYEIAAECARRMDAIVVLKGTPTIVAAPDGRRDVITAGNPGMATGGSGDVLTGVITALLGEGVAPFDAAALGAYIHARAGDMCAARLGERGIIASDIADAIPHALRELA